VTDSVQFWGRTPVSKECGNFGQRVQNSVFECCVDPQQWTLLKSRLLDIYEEAEDSLRFYFLGAKWESRIEHHGTKKSLDVKGTWFV
jgi:CRISPR-associated protein Cas2